MKRKLIALLAVAVLAGATYVLGYSTLFTVSSVEVMGSNKPITTGITKGEKLARVEPRAISAKIEMLDWVESADVSRNWINGKVVISLTPRTPIAIYKDQVIDSSGSSFVPQGEPPQGLIEINAASIEDAVKAVAFFTELPEELNSTLTVVKVRATGALVLLLENNGKKVEVRWGIDSDNELKTKVYKALITLPENADIKRVDVSAPH
ncbi:MAG: FtsQ-type POTRA domain-containing protein, partial [Candidatus Planktophila sp.]|nr:FtsQ-type POTRA domain-containing protein [Candidatus Planktophila sp.]